MLKELEQNKELIDSIFVFDSRGQILASSNMKEKSRLQATSLISVWIDFVDLEDCMSNYNHEQGENNQYDDNNLESSVFELKDGFASFISLLNRIFFVGVVSNHKLNELPAVLRFLKTLKKRMDSQLEQLFNSDSIEDKKEEVLER